MSDFKILWNTGMACADSIGHGGLGRAASTYDLQDAGMGARSRLFKMEPSLVSQGVEYSFNEDVPLSHVVVARADLLKTQQSQIINFDTRDAAGTYTNVLNYPSFDEPLIGVKGQDFVSEITQVGQRGIIMGGRTNGPDPESLMFSKFYASQAFDFGIEPDLSPGPSLEPVTNSDRSFRPLDGYRDYDTSHIITLNWTNLKGLAVENFRAIPKLLEWPMFLYDPKAHIWPWKLEHVVCVTYKETTIDSDHQSLSVTFRRLAHYK